MMHIGTAKLLVLVIVYIIHYTNTIILYTIYTIHYTYILYNLYVAIYYIVHSSTLY